MDILNAKELEIEEIVDPSLIEPAKKKVKLTPEEKRMLVKVICCRQR
jgi:hypothetical protein